MNDLQEKTETLNLSWEETERLHSFFNELQQALLNLGENIGLILTPILIKLVNLSRESIRILFKYRLMSIGFPERFASLIAYKLPWKIMPVKWIIGVVKNGVDS